ncbi:DUF5668 domain-containing protein [Dechloromonas sp. H13]|uniref:LiaI-LiaF-like domain-containing protein n=1 Tax=Dechloromonas sp. H13 TaxID=2570193 RepID=UPI001291053A|nr:DUF5668 domain-containing protein [Dechloromonas sp. H13]
MKGNFMSVALIVIGAIALAVNLDLIEFDLVALLRKWWPLALIALGTALFFTPDDGRRKGSGSSAHGGD